MQSAEIIVGPDFEGPPGVANGGYACGLVAPHLQPDAEVTLRRPVRLGAAVRLERRAGGLAGFDGADLVVEATSTTLAGGAPRPPTFAEALAATVGFPGTAGHPFPRCVVCGTARTDRSAFRIFPGPLPGRDLLAAVWYPGPDAVVDGVLRPEFAWAALDCPAGWAGMRFGQVGGPAVLGRMAARLDGPVPAGDAHILVGWLEGTSGRTVTAGSALYSRSGEPQAFSRQTWIVLARAGAA